MEPQLFDETLRDAAKRLHRYGFDLDRPETFETAWRHEDDGYLYRRLVSDLARLDRPGCIEAVLNATNDDGKNGWFHVREALGQTTGFVDDVKTWWQTLRVRNETDRSRGGRPKWFGKETRCVLMLATIHSLETDIHPELLKRLVDSKIWKSEQALFYAQQARDDYSRSLILAAIVKSLPTEQQTQVLTEALQFAQGIEDRYHLALALTAIAPSLPGEQQTQILKQVLEAAQSMGYGGYRYRLLSNIVPFLPADLLQQALETAQGIRQEAYRSMTLATIAPRLPIKERVPALQQAVESARNADDTLRWPEVLARSASLLPPVRKTQLLNQAYKAAQSIGQASFRYAALAAIAPNLPLNLLEQMLAAVPDIEEEEYQAWMLAAIAPRLPAEHRYDVLKQAVELLPSVRDEESRHNVLTTLAPNIPVDLLQQAFEAVQRIGDEEVWVAPLASLACLLPIEQRYDVQKQAIESVQGIGYEYSQSEALAAIAPKLSPDLLQQALEIARRIKGESPHPRFEALLAIAPYLPVEQKIQVLRQALEDAQRIGDERYQSQAMLALAPHLSADSLQHALEATRGMNSYFRSVTLAALAPCLPMGQQAMVFQQALEDARSVEYDAHRAEALQTIALSLPVEQQLQGFKQALEAAREIDREDFRSEALIAIAPNVPQDLLHQALESARSIEDAGYRSLALTALAPYLTIAQQAAVLQEALEGATQIEYEHPRAYAYWRSKVLAAIAPHLPAEQRTEVLQKAFDAAQSIGDEYLLSGIAKQINESQTELVDRILDAASLLDRGDALSIIEGLATALYEIGGEEAIRETIRAIGDVRRWWP